MRISAGIAMLIGLALPLAASASSVDDATTPDQAPDSTGTAPVGHPGDPVVRVSAGTVHLLTRSGRRIPIPSVMTLRQGDELITSPSVRGSLEIGTQTIPLTGLARYRLGPGGLEFARAGEAFAPVRPATRSTPAMPLPHTSVESAGDIIVESGQVRRQGEGWPTDEVLSGQAAVFPGDRLVLDTSARATLRREGASVQMRGPARLRLTAAGLAMDSGSALIRGRIPVVLDALGLNLRPARLFSVVAGRSFARVAVLEGVGRVEMTDTAAGGPLDDGQTSGRRLAPGMEVTFTPDQPLRVRAISIARTLASWGNPASGAALAVAAATTGAAGVGGAVRGDGGKGALARPVPGGKRAGRLHSLEGAPPLSLVDRDRQEPPRQHSRPLPLDGPATMPLRDRILAMESPSNRLFFFRKRDRIEAQRALDATDGARSEPERLARHKAKRALDRADEALAQFQRDKDNTFERGILLPDIKRDSLIGPQLESIYGIPLWLLARQEIPQFRALELSRKADAAEQTVQIQALRAGGASADQIGALEALRSGAIASAQAENDRMATLVRIEDEPAP